MTKLTGVLAREEISILGSVTNDSAEYGIIRMIVTDPEKACQAANLGITPQNDGTIIRLNFPQLTEERRRELTKQVAKYGEEAKVTIRNIRRDANDAAKKDQKNSLLTEDEEKTAEKDIQTLTDKYIKLIDDMIAAKNREVMAI